MRPCLRRCRASSGAARGCQACTRWPTASCPCLLVDLPSTGLILRDVDEVVDHVVHGLRIRKARFEQAAGVAEKALEALPRLRLDPDRHARPTHGIALHNGSIVLLSNARAE